MRRTLIGATLMMAAAVLATPALAQDNASAAALRTLIGNDAPLVAIKSGRMTEDGTDTLDFKLPKALGYWVYGRCDEDCEDIDLTIRNGSGETLAMDFESDSEVVHTLDGDDLDGDLSVTVEMPDCPRDSCTWAIAIVRQE